jgi:hypothetical protein
VQRVDGHHVFGFQREVEDVQVLRNALGLGGPDTAAGTLIAHEAGAHVVDAQGNPHTHRSASTIATAPGIARELATVVQTACAPGILQAATAT